MKKTISMSHGKIDSHLLQMSLLTILLSIEVFLLIKILSLSNSQLVINY